MFIILLAVFVIAALLLVLFSMQLDEASRNITTEHEPRWHESYFLIKKARLAMKGLVVEAGQGDPTPDMSYVVIAATLALLMGAVGFPIWSVFFLACYACCFSDFLQDLIAIHVVREYQQGRAFSTAQAI
jgi:hypothetical protein